nr:hypothetical protein [Acinetobacter wuhouensis]
MEILNFLRSFNTLNTYLILSVFVLIAIISFFYFVSPT